MSLSLFLKFCHLISSRAPPSIAGPLSSSLSVSRLFSSNKSLHQLASDGQSTYCGLLMGIGSGLDAPMKSGRNIRGGDYNCKVGDIGNEFVIRFDLLFIFHVQFAAGRD